MSQRILTTTMRTAIRTGYAALFASKSPNSEIVETVVYGLSSAGLLMDPQAAELTVYRASHDSIVFGLYSNPEAARAHCETYVRREHPAAVEMLWCVDEDDPDILELDIELDGRTVSTGYVVTPLTVTAAYDEEADH